MSSSITIGNDWRDRDFTGQRVGVIASGFDAVSIVPAVAATAHSLKVFQDKPSWVLPPLPRTVRNAGIYVPRLGSHMARIHLRCSVRDAWTRRLLTPSARFGDTRLTTSGRYYATFDRSNCTLITWPIYAVVTDGVRTADGIEHHLDCLVLGDSSAIPEGARS